MEVFILLVSYLISWLVRWLFRDKLFSKFVVTNLVICCLIFEMLDIPPIGAELKVLLLLLHEASRLYRLSDRAVPTNRSIRVIFDF